MGKILKVGVLAILLAMGLFAGCVGEKDNPEQQLKDATPAAIPLDIKLMISTSPSLGETAELVAIITSKRDAPNTSIDIEIPEGFELVDGNLSWKGSLGKNQPVQLTATIKAIRNGNWEIEGSVKQVVSEDSWWMDKDTIYVSIKD